MTMLSTISMHDDKASLQPRSAGRRVALESVRGGLRRRLLIPLTMGPAMGPAMVLAVVIAVVLTVVPGALLAEPCDDTCRRLSFTDMGGHFYDYVVSREMYLKMVEASLGAENEPPLSESEAVAIAAKQLSLSPRDVERVRYGRSVKPEGQVWFYRIAFQGKHHSDDIVIGPNGSVVEPALVEQSLTAAPDCSSYRFDHDAGAVGGGNVGR